MDNNIDIYFHYLKYCSSSYDDKFKKGLEFLKTLNLSDEQYETLGELMSSYGDHEYERHKFDMIDKTY